MPDSHESAGNLGIEMVGLLSVRIAIELDMSAYNPVLQKLRQEDSEFKAKTLTALQKGNVPCQSSFQIIVRTPRQKTRGCLGKE